MAEKPRRALAETLDERRPPRRDPRVEPESTRPDAIAGTLAPVVGGPNAIDGVERAPVMGTRQDVIGIAQTTDEYAAASGRRIPDSKSSLDSAAAAGASGMAALRRQLATLQMQLADGQAELGREQQSRAEDAEEMARVLERLATAEAEQDTLQEDLERERTFVEELRVSVREKYEDCNTLRQKLADAETLIAKELEEATERHALTARVETLEQSLAESNKHLEVSRASEESARSEIATLSSQLEILRRAFEKQEAELSKTNAAVKTANMKAFAANKQLESWKAESQRTMEQTRVEQDVVLAKMTAEHAKALEEVRREAGDAKTFAQSAEKQIAAANEKLALAAHSMEALEEAERQMQGLRDKAFGARRAALEHASHARKSLEPTKKPVDAPSVPVLGPRPDPAKKSRTAPPAASAPPVSKAPPVPSPQPPPAPAAVVREAGAAPTLAKEVSPVSPLAVTQVAQAPAGGNERPDQKSEAPLIEFGEIEMGADELVEDLILAKERSSKN